MAGTENKNRGYSAVALRGDPADLAIATTMPGPYTVGRAGFGAKEIQAAAKGAVPPVNRPKRHIFCT